MRWPRGRLVSYLIRRVYLRWGRLLREVDGEEGGFDGKDVLDRDEGGLDGEKGGLDGKDSLDGEEDGLDGEEGGDTHMVHDLDNDFSQRCIAVWPLKCLSPLACN